MAVEPGENLVFAPLAGWQGLGDYECLDLADRGVGLFGVGGDCRERKHVARVVARSRAGSHQPKHRAGDL